MAHACGARRSVVARLAVVGALFAFLATGCLVTPGDPGAADVTLTVDTSQANHPISPLIYGLNSPSQATLDATRATLLRLGLVE